MVATTEVTPLRSGYSVCAAEGSRSIFRVLFAIVAVFAVAGPARSQSQPGRPVAQPAVVAEPWRFSVENPSEESFAAYFEQEAASQTAAYATQPVVPANYGPQTQPTFVSPAAATVSDAPPADRTGVNRVQRTATTSVRIAGRTTEGYAEAEDAGEPLDRGAAPTAAQVPSTLPAPPGPFAASLTAAPVTAAAPAVDAAAASRTSASPLSVELLQSNLQQYQSDASLDPALKTQLVGLYESILAELRKRSENEKSAREYGARAEAAPAAIAEAKRRLENPPKLSGIDKNELRRSKLEALQSMLQQQQTAAQTVADARTEIDAKLSTRDARKKELFKWISEEKAQQTKLSEDIAKGVTGEAEPRVAEAKSLQLRARLAASIERSKALEQELRTSDAESELLPRQRELLNLEEKAVQTQLNEVQAELNSRRETRIDDLRLHAENVLNNSPTAEQRAVAEDILKRGGEWLEVVRSNRNVKAEAEQSLQRRSLWEERFQNIKKRIGDDEGSVGALNSWMGLMLRRQRSELPSLRRLRQELADSQDRLQKIDSTTAELDDWRARAAGSAGLADDVGSLEAMRREMINDFRIDAREYFDNLDSLCVRKTAMIKLVEEYRGFIDQHVLWIRSGEVVKKTHFQQMWAASQWLFNAAAWRDVLSTLGSELRTRIGEVVVFAIGWVVLIANTRKMRRKIKSLGDLASRNSQTSFAPTAKAVLLTFLISAPFPALLAYVGLRLYAAQGATPFVQQLGFGLAFTARYFIVFEILRQVCRSGGLAEKHLGWPLTCTQRTRKHLRWFLDLSLPLVAVVAMVFDGGDELFENSLGRFSYIAFILLCAVALGRLLHPRQGAISEYVQKHRDGWIDRLRYVWYSAAVATPVALAVGSAFGYHYTAVSLSMLLHRTVMTLLGIFVIYCLTTRWLLLNRRSLAIAQARQRLEDAQRESALAASGSIPNDVRSTEFRNEVRNEQNAVDLAAINAQTISLVSACGFVAALVAIWLIWADVLPAVNALESFKLYPIAGDTPDAKTWITLSDIVVAVPIVCLTFLAVRNLPGLLEIALLQHLPIENAMRYAITTVSRYLLLTVGVVTTFNYLGLQWSSIQWLVAALGVGLGFGLQEIFANFISGLILLFEQPIRVGDIITIGDTSGAVARIRMRATTITNWDRQELVVPNKDLITGRLLNWTLSDSTNRMVIPVGIAYGSDTQLACRILQEVCLAHSNVLKDPPPTAFFEGFADSSLQLTLRFFLQTLDTRLVTRHELLTEIHTRFAGQGIEIAFPQRDLHLRSVPESVGKYLKAFASESRGEAASLPRKAG